MSEMDAPIRKHDVWVFPGGRTIPVIAGAEDPPDPKDPADPKADPDPKDPPDPKPDPKPDPAEGALPDAVKEVLAKERKAAREAEKRAKAAEAKAKEYEDAQKSEAEKTAERAETAERERDEARAELLRARVAARVGLPDELVDRLRGDTEEALEDDAKSLLAAMGVTPGKKKPPPARDGDTPQAKDLDSQIAAAEKAGDWKLSTQLKARKSAAPKE